MGLEPTTSCLHDKGTTTHAKGEPEVVGRGVVGHWGDGDRVCGCQSRVGGHCTRELHGAAAVGSIVMDGQSIRSEVAAVVTHNSDSQ